MSEYEKIIERYRKHSKEAHGDDGSVRISGFPKFSEFGINFSRISQEQARALLVASSFSLAYSGMNVFITEDQVRLWDAVGKHLLDPPSLYFNETNDKPFPWELSYLRTLFVTTIKTETGEWSLVQKSKLSEWNWFNATPEHPFPSHSTKPAEYFVFPLFEAVLKNFLSEYIDFSGVVKKEFRNYKVGQRCSNIGHLLTLMLNRSNHPSLISDSKIILELIQFIYPNRDAAEVIANEWRNPALHGDQNVSTSSGLILNLTLLVAVNSCTEVQWDARFDV
ncbi:hypothetical protein [Paraglaciecola psychrophila]|jgi:hypothetical protein|nr:hypothetical protein [Paraglaciecola psychrophila]GAC37144.1 hypothetical protein GPSY_1511 [Paraglaciecola psychrophila 170]